MQRLLELFRSYGATLIVVFFVLTNLSWIARDTSPFLAGDSYVQATGVLHAVDDGWPTSAEDLSTSLRNLSHGGRPPLYQLATIPCVLFFGRSQDALLAVNLVLLPILMFGVYGLAKSIAGRSAGIVAMIVVASFPTIAQVTRSYRSYFGAYAAIAVTLCFLILMLRERRIRYPWAAASACSVALLMHPTSLRVLFVPMAMTWVWSTLIPAENRESFRSGDVRSRFMARLRDPFVFKGLLPAAFIPIFAAGWWYASFGRNLFHLYGIVNSGWIADYRGLKTISSFGERPADLRWYALTSPSAISLPLAVGLVLAAIFVLIRWKLAGRFLVVWLFTAYLVIGSQSTLNWSYAGFAFPIVAAVLACGAAAIRSPRGRQIAFYALVAVSLFNYSIVTWGWPSHPQNLSRFWGIGSEPCAVPLCPDPSFSGRWPFGEVVAAISEEAPTAPSAPVSAFVLTPDIIPDVFNYTAVEKWPDKRIRFIGQQSPLWGIPFPIDVLLRSEWLIVRRPLIEVCNGSLRNFYQSAAACFLQDPPREFEAAHLLIGRYRLPDGDHLDLLRRKTPLTLEETDATLAGLDLERRFTVNGEILAASFLERAGRFDEAMFRLDSAAEIEGLPPVSRSKVLSSMTMLLLRMGQVDAAVDKGREAVLVAPWDAVARTRLGLALKRAGRLEEARKELEEACRLAPAMKWPHDELENVRKLMNDREHTN
jgi:tetratricopeptide (TPR) repeat protein